MCEANVNPQHSNTPTGDQKPPAMTRDAGATERGVAVLRDDRNPESGWLLWPLAWLTLSPIPFTLSPLPSPGEGTGR